MERNYYQINEELARKAQSMWSFSEYKTDSKTEEYRKLVDEAYDLADRVAVEKPEKVAEAYVLADKYAKKIADNFNARSRIEMICPSVMIVGSAKFPVQKKEKQNKARERNYEEYQKIQNYLDKIESLLYDKERILSKDQTAIQKLQEKLDALEQKQQHMKKVNAYYRKHKKLDGCPDSTPEEIAGLQLEMQNSLHYEDKPYLSWQLTNNNQNIHRTKERIASLKAAKEKETSEYENKHFKVVENTEIMRLQLFFDGKPEVEIREAVKHSGFKWSPKNQCWQRQLTKNAKYALQYLVEKLDNLIEEQKKL